MFDDVNVKLTMNIKMDSTQNWKFIELLKDISNTLTGQKPL